MQIGVPKEIKNHEYRVGLTPSSVSELVRNGHSVIVETLAGSDVGFDDEQYRKVGATIVSTPQEVFAQASLIVKVKEPQPQECKMLREGQTIFTFLHLAPDPEQAKHLIQSRATAIAYETVTDSWGALPLLAPMSEVAGRMSIQIGAQFLEKHYGGSGVLLGGVPGVHPGKVVILGGGVVGTNAAHIAVGMGAEVILMDNNSRRLRELNWQFNSRVKTIFSTHDSIAQFVADADLVVGAVLTAGAAAPKLVDAAMVGQMRPGSVLIDVAIDQGGCFETSRLTSHADPIYTVGGVIHYCVPNIPGAVARTSTMALNNVTLPFVKALANKGVIQALQDDPHLQAGLNVHRGHLTHEAVAQALGYDLYPLHEALAA